MQLSITVPRGMKHLLERYATATEAWAILHRHPLDPEVAQQVQASGPIRESPVQGIRMTFSAPIALPLRRAGFEGGVDPDDQVGTRGGHGRPVPGEVPARHQRHGTTGERLGPVIGRERVWL